MVIKYRFAHYKGFKKDSWNFNCVNFDRVIHNGDREEHDP
jgi:hypothetical protein